MLYRSNNMLWICAIDLGECSAMVRLPTYVITSMIFFLLRVFL